MKLKVPFYKAERDGDCGPLALKMVLEYFGKNYDLEKLSDLSGSTKEGYTWTIGLAKAATELRFKTSFFSSTLEINPENFEDEFYKKHMKDDSEKVLQDLIDRCKELGVLLEERTISFEDIISFVSEDSIPIVLLDWNVIKEREGYQGHIVPIVGYDDENIYVHHPGPEDAQEFFPIKQEIFDRARKSEGTDEDIVIIYKST